MSPTECHKCGTPRIKTTQALYADPLWYLWRCSGCGDAVYLEEPGGLAVTSPDQPLSTPPEPCMHTGPQCECVCHTNGVILHDHACCSPCNVCGFRVPCACARCCRKL